MIRFGPLRPVVRLFVCVALAAPRAALAAADGPAESEAAIASYLKEEKGLEVDGNKSRVRPYDYFANLPPGRFGVEGIPLILFRLLPELADRLGDRDPECPERPLFGEPGQNFATFGFLSPPDRKLKAVPLGFSWTEPAPPQLPLSITARTCAGCHVGRVRLDDGKVAYIWGGPNTEVLLHQYDAAITGFFRRHLDGPRSRELLAAEIRTLVAEKQEESGTWFFRDADGYHVAEERRQVEAFLRGLDQVLATIGAINALRVAPRQVLRGVAYGRPNSPPIDGGPPGFIDSSGLGIAAFVRDRSDLFPGATKNDVPSVWNQRTRKLFQWDGNIRDTITRNMVASLGLVGKPELLDIRANFIISDFIDGLPAPRYPFPVDRGAARRGEEVFKKNCLVCHRPDQHRGGPPRDDPAVYMMGTDTNRARVVTPGGFLAIRQALVDGYQPPDLRFRYGAERTEVEPTAIDPDALLVDRTAVRDQGYVANPLDGIWARAPYLHNGSVPTLRHLLVPKLRARAAVFVRGIISYDQEDVGWVWDPRELPRYKDRDLSARLYDTALDGQSNRGHDRKWVKVGGRTYRLSWDREDDREVGDLLEYLKTL